MKAVIIFSLGTAVGAAAVSYVFAKYLGVFLTSVFNMKGDRR